MRGKRPDWLIIATGEACLAVAALWPHGRMRKRARRAYAPPSRKNRPMNASPRVAVCCNRDVSAAKPLGVAYGLRGLAFLDRGDIRTRSPT